MANSFHAFINLEDYMGWIELFGLEEEEPITQKRILSVVSGAVLPLVALGFIKSLTDYIRPDDGKTISSENVTEEIADQPIEELEKVVEKSSNDNNNAENDVLTNVNESTVDLSRVSKTKVHHVEEVVKDSDDSLLKEGNSSGRKHYISKP